MDGYRSRLPLTLHARQQILSFSESQVKKVSLIIGIIVSVACPGNQIYYYRCAPCQRTCDNLRRSCPPRCRPGCRCPPGFVLNPMRRRCVPIWFCLRGSRGESVHKEHCRCLFHSWTWILSKYLKLALYVLHSNSLLETSSVIQAIIIFRS